VNLQDRRDMAHLLSDGFMSAYHRGHKSGLTKYSALLLLLARGFGTLADRIATRMEKPKP